MLNYKSIPQIILLLSCVAASAQNVVPTVTLIFVIDQYAYRYTNQMRNYLKASIKQFADAGVVFTNAHHPNGMPATCTGHTDLNTGAYADTHGIVGNAWYEHGKKMACDDDLPDKAPVINPRGGHYEESKSPRAILVDGISDQFVLGGTPEEPHAAYSFGIKSRATIATSNKCGMPFWFDTRSGMFTTSTAYVKTLPDWLVQFNNAHPIASTLQWQQKYTEANAYPYGTSSYAHGTSAKPLINTTVIFDTTQESPYDTFVLMPQANQQVIDCACACIEQFYAQPQNKDGKLLIWVCLGSLDKIGHIYGPLSKEIWDMVYWLDEQIATCIACAQKVVGTDNVLSVLTSDHGVPPIPEDAHARGLTNSVRLDGKELMREINDCIELEYGIPHIVHDIKNSSLYFSNVIKNIPHGMRKKISKRVQEQLQSSPYIAHAWLPDKIAHQWPPTNTVPYRLKRQFFAGRSGDIIIETRPYVQLTMKKSGTGHLAPYTYNTHVPLMLLWPGNLKPMAVDEKVTTTQLAPTLAAIMQVAQPAGAEDAYLPCVLHQEQCAKSR